MVASRHAGRAPPERLGLGETCARVQCVAQVPCAAGRLDDVPSLETVSQSVSVDLLVCSAKGRAVRRRLQQPVHRSIPDPSPLLRGPCHLAVRV